MYPPLQLPNSAITLAMPRLRDNLRSLISIIAMLFRETRSIRLGRMIATWVCVRLTTYSFSCNHG